MARERYLVGVSKEELEYHSPKQPQTPKNRWVNFWYYHKWLVLGAAALVAVVTFLIVQAVTRVKPDYLICMVTRQGVVSQTVIEHLENELAACGNDRNGDGQVVVRIQCLDVSTDNPQSMQTANHQSILGHMASKDVHLYFFDPTYYEQTVCGAMKDGAQFFDTLGVSVAGVSEDNTYWNWENAAFFEKDVFKNAESWEKLPKSMVCGVRAADDKWYSDAQKEEQQACLVLLKTFLTKQAV